MVPVEQTYIPDRIPAPQPAVTILYTAEGTPVQVVNVGSDDGKYHQYNTRAAKILGMLQIILGCLIILSQIIVSAVHATAYEGFTGIWASTVFILAGAFGVRSAKSKSRCTVIVTMVLSIIGAVFSIGCIIQGSIGAAMASNVYSCHYYPSHVCGYYWTMEDRVGVTFHATMAVLAFIEGIVAIMASAYCCLGSCCQKRPGVMAASGFPQAVHYQHNPTPYFTMPPASETVVACPFDSNAGAPAYARSNTPPPEYKEKMSL